MSKTPVFEKSLARLEEIVAQLGDETLPLEKAVALYGEGVKLAAACQKTLETARLKLETLSPPCQTEEQGEDRHDGRI